MQSGLEPRRAMGRADLEWCARLMAGSEPWITLRRGYDSALGILLDPSREVYIAAAGRRRLGFIVIVMTGAFKGYIQTIAVDPARRGSGVGRALISFAERRILAETPNVFMCVSSFNHGARKLYERLGYEAVGELKDYVVQGLSEILLRKTTGPLSDFQPAGKVPRSQAASAKRRAGGAKRPDRLRRPRG